MSTSFTTTGVLEAPVRQPRHVLVTGAGGCGPGVRPAPRPVRSWYHEGGLTRAPTFPWPLPILFGARASVNVLAPAHVAALCPLQYDAPLPALLSADLGWGTRPT